MPPYYSTNLLTTFGLCAADATLVSSAQQSWQRVHHLLISSPVLGTLPDDLPGFAIYHYCAYEASGRPPAEAARVRHLFSELVARLREKPLQGLAWSAMQLTQACAVAWLSPRLAEAGLGCPPAWLPELDKALYAEALRLRQQADASSRCHLVQVLRYLRLRLPATRHYLAGAIDFMDYLFPSQGIWPLGLDEGLAAELLGLIQAHELGLQDAAILERVRAGIRYLLALRRQTDFLDQAYSVFPYEVAFPTNEPAFSPELSWRRGDLGQSLLLYRAHDLLGDQELIKIAELVGLNTMLRTSVTSTGVNTAHFFQGAAGIAYLYLKLYHISGQTSYYQSHQFWLVQTQQWLPPALLPNYVELQAPPSGLLHGLAGIGLVLLASTSPLTLDWDALIL
jgi:hypothetical protein